MDEQTRGFRSAIFGGFNREDVLHYIEETDTKYYTETAELRSQLTEAQSAMNELRTQNEALTAKNAELLERLGEMTLDTDKIRAQLDQIESGFSLQAIEIATGNTLATKSEISGRKRTTADVLCGVMAQAMVGDFMKQISTRMATKISTGQSVAVRFTIDPGSAINMDTEINNIMPLSDILVSWVKRHAKNGKYHTQGRTSTLLAFSDIFVDNSMEDGMQSDVNDFALALYQYLKGLNLSVSRTITGNSIDVIIY